MYNYNTSVTFSFEIPSDCTENFKTLSVYFFCRTVTQRR